MKTDFLSDLQGSRTWSDKGLRIGSVKEKNKIIKKDTVFNCDLLNNVEDMRNTTVYLKKVSSEFIF